MREKHDLLEHREGHGKKTTNDRKSYIVAGGRTPPLPTSVITKICRGPHGTKIMPKHERSLCKIISLFSYRLGTELGLGGYNDLRPKHITNMAHIYILKSQSRVFS